MNRRTGTGKGKRILTVALAALFAALGFSFVGCGKEEQPAAKESISVGEPLALLSAAKPDLDNTIFDDFSAGVNMDRWYIANQSWGAAANGGVIPQNVGYTDDGVLVFTANGAHYKRGEVAGVGRVRDGSLTGGVLISKFAAGPGRYQVRMKVLPRLGACTAMWVYAYKQTDSAALNHEIDIELPGGKSGGTIAFDSVLNTNYTTEQYFISEDVRLAQATGKQDVYLNDGEWHTFGFDWYTDPETVVYSVDGVVTAVTTAFVPTLQSRLWLGVWIPNNSGFVGSPNFETDYMQVDWFRYTPFAGQPYEEYSPTVGGVASEAEYPAAPTKYAPADKVSNGTFEYVGADSMGGWVLSGDCALAAQGGADSSAGILLRANGVLRQDIDAVYPGFTYTLSFAAKTQGTVYADIFWQTEVNTVSTQTVEIAAEDWTTFARDLVAPAGCTKMRIEFYAKDASAALSLDNVSLVFEGRAKD